MSGYTKLFSSIIHSTIWREDMPTKIVWITMLAMADQHGEVMASVPGLADAARVSIDDCRTSLEKLMSPDSDSRTPDDEGRRVRVIQGGWAIINHGAYRDLQSATQRRQADAERQRRRREAVKSASVDSIKEGENMVVVPVLDTSRDASRDMRDVSRDMSQSERDKRDMSQMSRHTEAEAEADTDTKDSTPLPPKGGDAQGVLEEKPSRRKAPPKSAIPPEETLEGILGDKESQMWRRYWTIVSLWPSEKNPAPKATAKAWVKACAKARPPEIYRCALCYKDRFLPPARQSDETRFMVSPLKWLEEESWMNESNAIREP